MIRTIVYLICILTFFSGCGNDDSKPESLIQIERIDEYSDLQDKFYDAEDNGTVQEFLSGLSSRELSTSSGVMTFAGWVASNGDKEAVASIIQNTPTATARWAGLRQSSFWANVAEREFGSDLIDFSIMNKYGHIGGNSLHFIAWRPNEADLMEKIEAPHNINQLDDLWRSPSHRNDYRPPSAHNLAGE